MRIKSSVAGFIIAATTMFVAVGPVQAAVCQADCFYNQSGWHMVPKSCALRPAANWQAYASGVYLQPFAVGSVIAVGQ